MPENYELLGRPRRPDPFGGRFQQVSWPVCLQVASYLTSSRAVLVNLDRSRDPVIDLLLVRELPS